MPKNKINIKPDNAFANSIQNLGVEDQQVLNKKLYESVFEILRNYALEWIEPIENGVRLKMKRLYPVDILLWCEIDIDMLSKTRVNYGHYRYARKTYYHNKKTLLLFPPDYQKSPTLKQLEKDRIILQVKTFLDRLAIKFVNRNLWDLDVPDDPLAY
jgi:hypothetical protein